MAALTYAHGVVLATTFASKSDLNAADLNDNFFGDATTTGIIGVLNPTSTSGGLETINNIHASAGFLPLQFREPFGRGSVYGQTIQTSAIATTYAMTLKTTPAATNPAYYVLDCMTVPENGYLTRVSVNIAAITGTGAQQAEAFPLTFRVLMNEHPSPQISGGTRQYKAKNPGLIVLTADDPDVGDNGRRANNVAVPAAKLDTLYFFMETDEAAVSGPVTITLKWNLNFKFLQRKGP